MLKGSVFSLGVPLCVVEYEVEVDDRLKKLRSFGGGEGYRGQRNDSTETSDD